VLTTADGWDPRVVAAGRVCAIVGGVVHHQRYGPGAHALPLVGTPAGVAWSHPACSA